MSTPKDVDDDTSPPDAETRAGAQALGRLVDGLVSGATPPAALDAEARALLETATMIHAATNAPELGAARTTRALDAAFRTGAKPAPPVAATPLRRRGWAPWAIAVLSAAAAIVLFLRTPARAQLPAAFCSRPADPLVGQIAVTSADDARGRMDVIYADRLSGYRELTLFARAP